MPADITKAKNPLCSADEIKIPFQSKQLRCAIEPGEDTANNLKFSVSLFVPSDFNELPIKHLLIMVNGMGEFNPHVYSNRGRDTSLCTLLHQSGIATCFLPLPFHFNRMSPADRALLEESRKRRKRAIRKGKRAVLSHPTVEKIMRTPARFFLGYEQVKDDIKELTRIINKSKRTGHIPEDVKISLWGFSIGGLGVLGRYFESPQTYHSCILVHSGANFQTLGYYREILTKPQWNKMKKFWTDIRDALEEENYNYLNKQMPELVSLNLDELKMFAMLFLGNDHTILVRKTRRNSHKLFLLVGGKDEVASLESVVSTLVPSAGLAICTIPELTHNIHDSQNIWLTYELEVLKAFLDHRPGNKKRKEHGENEIDNAIALPG